MSGIEKLVTGLDATKHRMPMWKEQRVATPVTPGRAIQLVFVLS